MERWMFLIYGLLLSVFGICGFFICLDTSVLWFSIFSAKGAFLGFGIYGIWVSYSVIKYWSC